MNILKHFLTVALFAGITVSASAEIVTDTWNFNKPATGKYSDFYLSTDSSSPDYYGNYLPEGWMILGTNSYGWKISPRKNGVDNLPCLVALDYNNKSVAIVFFAHKGTLGFNMKARSTTSTYSVIRLFEATPDDDTYIAGDLSVMKEVEDLSATDYKVIDIEVPADGYYALTITGMQYINDISNSYEATSSQFSAGGIVTDEAQTPVAGVAVKVGEADTLTDAEGKWSVTGLVAGSYTAEFGKTGYVSQSVPFDITDADKSDISVVLKPVMLSFTARVTSGGEALTDATVTLTDPDSDVMTVPESETPGVYVLNNINAVVAADKPYTVSIDHPGYKNESATVVFDYTDVNNTYTLTQMETVLTGTVTASGGNTPLNGVEISLAASDDETDKYTSTTDDQGKYVISLKGVIAETYKLTASRDGYVDYTTNVGNLKYGEENTLSFSMNITLPSAVNDIDFTQRQADIFTIDGKKIKAGDTLAPGIYIIDGKKVMIR